MTVRCSWLRASSLRLAAFAGAVLCAAAPATAAASLTLAPQEWVHEKPARGDFALAARGATASIIYDAADAPVVARASADLAADIQRVTGTVATSASATAKAPRTAILVGTLGKSPLIDRLAKNGKLNAADLRGKWESFLITTVDAPFPGMKQALVIAGSDPRGTAYGIYELSEAIGVSPWYWWADVPAKKRSALFIAAGTRRFGPPSVKYRGIFINDEDWGLQPWAAKTLEPESGGIGPKTYGRMFELLLRLKANTVWPAMHPGTPPFNAHPRNAALADDYAIVMGSSHAEPMLRNNVGEWKAPHEEYNYVSNADGVRRYWEERMSSNGGYENIYTLGMRGIHDSGMQGAKSDAERIALLQKIFSDQRGLLSRYALPAAPQMFCAYKEVLPLYRQGLKVPDDVTIVWPDDNFGYIRNFSGAAERARSGGSGVYYHLSYLGAPLSYLWLYTTPPALVWAEMSRAYAEGADRMWIANVGDLKPAEIGTEFFLRLAWDVRAWKADAQPVFLRQWAEREFGVAAAGETASIMGEYYRLNFARRPEHLQWWLPKEARRASDWSAAEVNVRLAEFAALRRRVESVRGTLPAAAKDAFFELVEYPVLVSALANQRFFEGERGDVEVARGADTALQRLTAHWDGELAGGKWRHIMSAEPADEQWKSMRIAKWTPPGDAAAADVSAGVGRGLPLRVEAERFQRQSAERAGSIWTRVAGLGKTGEGAVAILRSGPSLSAEASLTDAPWLEYDVELPAGGFELRVHMLPTFPSVGGGKIRFGVALDGELRTVDVEAPDGGAAWAQGVLNNDRMVTVPLRSTVAGRHMLRFYGSDAGLAVDSIELMPVAGVVQ